MEPKDRPIEWDTQEFNRERELADVEKLKRWDADPSLDPAFGETWEQRAARVIKEARKKKKQ